MDGTALYEEAKATSGVPNFASALRHREREFFIDNLLVRIHFIIVMIRWTGLAPWEFEFPFPGSLTSTFLDTHYKVNTKTSHASSRVRVCGLGLRVQGLGFQEEAQDASVVAAKIRPLQGAQLGTVLNLRTTTSHKCAVVPSRARI